MGSTVPWDVELAFWTLKHILPNEHPKYNSACILNSSANYIEELCEKLQNIRCRVILSDQQMQPDGYIADRRTFLISDEEELELLGSLGLNKSDDKFEGAHPEWLEAISTNLEYVFSDNEENAYSNAAKMQPSDTKVKRPGNGFIRFSTEKRKEVLRLHPHSDNRQVSKILGVMWRKLTPEEKKPYINQFVEHINVIRISHPEWNYAASRAKSNVPSTKDSVVLQRRLRNRNVLPKYVQQEEMYTGKQISRSSPKVKGNSKSRSEQAKLITSSDEEKIMWANCDVCNKWRKMPSDLNADSLPFSWICAMNTDPLHNSCDKEQEDE